MEYLFRGKRKDNSEWVYGYYFFKWRTQQHVIHCSESEGVLVDSEHEVLPETVGMWSGLNDVNGKKIFDGDLDNRGRVIAYINSAFWSHKLNSDANYPLHFHAEHNPIEFEIIGTIHDKK